ncbi:preprotein translocase subunit SecE [Motilibacter rhizosphaerae]|uniref:preprotein translocase subunit SecE n=1 Tax=Motilibacter rhizosphaerae TaxID=598652 RepID=UPI0013EECAD0
MHDGSSAVPERDVAPASRSGARAAVGRGGPLARLSLYIRQVVAELRKVIWPTRNELTTYTTVVIVFVIAMIALLSVLDYGFGRLMFWVFG